MDGNRFDQLSRRLASLSNRRRALKAVAGGVAAVIAGDRLSTGAQSCTSHYGACQSDSQCCPGAICQWGICMPGCRIEGQFHNAWTPQPDNTCANCRPELSTTTWSPANEGAGCWSGSSSLCGSGPSSCQNGTCAPSAQITCQPLTVCHEAGQCDPGTGLCSQPPAAAGKVCGGTEMCLGGFHTPSLQCDGNGFCVGQPTVSCAPYTCGGNRCHINCDHAGQCAPGAVCLQNECLYLRENGENCPADHHCRSGHCVEGICCDTACTGLCDVCGTGACLLKNCGDGKPCTSDSCDESTGACIHAHDTTTDTCYINETCYQAGAANPSALCDVCDPERSRSSWSAKICDDGEGCTSDSCNASTGQCTHLHDTTTDTCYIDGICIPDGTVNPSALCEVCDPERSPGGWSTKICDDGNWCTSDHCDASTGACVHTRNTTDTCCIDGVTCGACGPVEIWGEITEATSTFGICYIHGDLWRTWQHGFFHPGGPIQIGVRGSSSAEGGTMNNPDVDLYTAYDPAHPCDNRIGFDFNSGCGLDGLLTLDDLAPGCYTAVVLGATVSSFGTFVLTFGMGPGSGIWDGCAPLPN